MSSVNPSARAALSAGAPVPFAEEDLSRVFDQKTMQRGRALLLAGAARLASTESMIEAAVTDLGRTFITRVTPLHRAQRLALERSCTCGRPACAHMAAAAMLALDTRPEWRRPVQTSLLDLIGKAPAPGSAPIAPVSLGTS